MTVLNFTVSFGLDKIQNGTKTRTMRPVRDAVLQKIPKGILLGLAKPMGNGYNQFISKRMWNNADLKD